MVETGRSFQKEPISPRIAKIASSFSVLSGPFNIGEQIRANIQVDNRRKAEEPKREG